ncbi:MAG: phage holin family protein [Planctomycetota bacterium]|nr:phage holin family protein [Planctomycetota bacterium]
MVDSEKMRQEYQHASPVGQFRSSAGKFGCDLLELAELQGKLLKVDAKSALEKSLGAILCALIGCLSLLGCMPVLFLGAASAVAYSLALETWVSQLVVGSTLSLVSIGTIGISLKRLSKTGEQFKRSTEEFTKNFEWAKDIFSSDSSK